MKPSDTGKWQLQEAKARLSELVRRAQTKPQTITVRGQSPVVVVSRKQYEKTQGKKTSLVKLLQESPLFGVELDLPRDKTPGRSIKL